MLSGETAIGAFPIAAVDVMNRIAYETERNDAYGSGTSHRSLTDLAPAAARSDAHAIARAAKALAIALPARLIVVLTASGRTAGIMASERPGVPIIALTTSAEVARRLAVWHGVAPVVYEERFENDAAYSLDAILAAYPLVAPGDRIVVVSSVPRPPRQMNISLQIQTIVTSAI